MTNRKILPLSIVPNTPCHLFYVDDILLYLKGNKKGLQSLKEVLANYQVSYGQSINLVKSKFFIGKCNQRTRRQILAISNLPEHPLSSNYLGAPLWIGTPKRHHFNQLLDRFLSKLSGWKLRLLSSAGREILVRHVLSSLPTHIAMVLPLP